MYTGKQIQLDLVKKRCRRFSRLLYFIKLGDFWEKIPSKFKEVSVSKVKLKASGFVGIPVLGFNKSTSCYTFRVYVRSDFKNVLVYDGNLKTAKKEATKIGEYLGLKVVDYTQE